MAGTLDLEAFAHVVAHDLSAPLRGMSIHLKLLARDLDAGDAGQAKERMQLLQQRLQRMDQMLRRVRHFSKVHVAAGAAETVEMSDIVAETLQHIDTRDATVEVTGAATVRGAPLLILTVCQELIRNAVEHHDGRPTVRVEISDGAVTITDDGPGLGAPAETLQQLFAGGGSRVLDGAGSGLALSGYIAHHLGGDLALESPVNGGRGVRATLRLPSA